MGWVRIDDEIFLNRKIVEVGKDATLLYLAGLTMCAKHGTDGHLSEAQVRLAAGAVDVRPRLADSLVKVGLWEAEDGGYVVPDYLEYNPSSQAEQERRRKEREKKRQQRARGAGKAFADGKVVNGTDGKFSSPAASPGDSTEDRGGESPGESPSTPFPSSTSSSSTTSEGSPSGGDDDFDFVIDHLALYDLERLREDKPDHHVGDVDRWLASAKRRRTNIDGQKLRDLIAEHPDWDRERLLDAMTGTTKPSALDATAAAAAQLRERTERRKHGEVCPKCDDVGVVELDDGSCDDCDCKYRRAS